MQRQFCTKLERDLSNPPILPTLDKEGASGSHAHFVGVTEMAGNKISHEQLERMCNRYYWARPFVQGRDIAEVACGAGQGLGYLAQHAKSVLGGDISAEVLAPAQCAYGDTLRIEVFDAAAIPVADHSLDAILLFEAIYYLPDLDAFLAEARRALRPSGTLLIATANRELFDFVPSPFSQRYYSLRELNDILTRHGFDCDFAGFVDVAQVSLRQRVLRPIKSIAAKLGLIPKSMAGKEWLKRLFFGELIEMPLSILDTPLPYTAPTPLARDQAVPNYKVIYCAATLRSTAV